MRHGGVDRPAYGYVGGVVGLVLGLLVLWAAAVGNFWSVLEFAGVLIVAAFVSAQLLSRRTTVSSQNVGVALRTSSFVLTVFVVLILLLAFL